MIRLVQRGERVAAGTLLSLAAVSMPACDRESDPKTVAAPPASKPAVQSLNMQERRIEVSPIYTGPPKESPNPKDGGSETNGAAIEKPGRLRSIPDAFELYGEVNATGALLALRFRGTDVLEGSRSGYSIETRGHYLEGSETLSVQGKTDFRIPLPNGSLPPGGRPLNIAIRFRDDANRPSEFNTTVENLGDGIIRATANEWR